MMFLQLFVTIILLLNISVKTYSVPYEGTLAFSTTSKLIYTSESNPIITGYSYGTRDSTGDGSNVVFTIGADSADTLKSEMNLFHETNDENTSDKYLQRDILNRIPETSSSELTSKKVETNTTKQNDLESNVETLNEKKELSKNSEILNDNFVDYQIPQRVSLVPYPAFRSNLLNLQVPTIQAHYSVPSDTIQDPYYLHNPYTRLELPIHDFDFYNPTVPLFYQSQFPITIPDMGFPRLAPIISEDTKTSANSSAAQDSQINATESTSLKSNVIESRSKHVETTTNIDEETLSNEPSSTNKLESMTTSERVKEEIMNSESMNSTEVPKTSVEQITENKANNTESVKATSLMEKSSAE